ncbi:MAG: D-3-phosphoglycerate dehydrogenase / 2-oxoglutarate reductase [Candidatus Petromonas sp.]|jgi:D-3-phosphoglycerate dehydrogenase|nr:D-3-phosphoglycerate dehydrogenase / 2-oxoglutarate reductase [Candidatus Petromonas sp.]
MIRVLVTDGIDKNASASLQEAGFEVVEEHYESEELKEKVKEFDAIVVRSATKVPKPKQE